MKKSDLDPKLVAQLVSCGVDLDRMVAFMNDLNAGTYDTLSGIEPTTVPDISNPSIIPRTFPCSTLWKMKGTTAAERFKFLELPFLPESVGFWESDSLVFDEAALKKIGIYLYPKTAYGLLNGGTASSYTDIKKNRSINPRVFEKYRDHFDSLAQECKGKPKALTPAYINQDGSFGYNFLLLKLRMILEHKRQYYEMTGKLPCKILPAFQLTSFQTHEAIQNAFRNYILLPELKDIADSIGCSTIEMFTETQTMMAAFTHSSEGFPRRIFDKAEGKPNTGIALPGGHGQNFEILAPIYRKMYSQGIRYVWIGNIDNLGYTIDPVSLAIFALSGKEASFETSYRTSMDVKGGILVCDEHGKFTCADIGPAVSSLRVQDFESRGKSILFNCGIGLFDLEKLLPRLPSISHDLPIRITDQDKDVGLYAQAEQITWEIIALLDDPLFFTVEKSERFIAAKMLLETIMTSLPPENTDCPNLAEVSQALHRGMTKLLASEYGLIERDGHWSISQK